MFSKIKKWFAARKARKAELKYADSLPYMAVITNHAEYRMFSVIVKRHVFLIPHKDQHTVYYFGEHLSPSNAIYKAIRKELEPEAELRRYNSCNPQSWIYAMIKQGEGK